MRCVKVFSGLLLMLALLCPLTACSNAADEAPVEADTTMTMNATVQGDATESEPEAAPEAEAETQSQAEVELETQSETELEVELEVAVEAEAEVEAEDELDVEAEVEIEVEVETEDEVSAVVAACHICQSEQFTSYDGAALCDSCYAHIQTAAQAYADYLEPMFYFTTFGLFDLNKDGIPELVTSDGAQIYTYSASSGRAWESYYAYVTQSIYASTKTAQMLEVYSFNGSGSYVLYNALENGSFEYVEGNSSQTDGYEAALSALASQMVLVEANYTVGDATTMLTDLLTAIGNQ